MKNKRYAEETLQTQQHEMNSVFGDDGVIVRCVAMIAILFIGIFVTLLTGCGKAEAEAEESAAVTEEDMATEDPAAVAELGTIMEPDDEAPTLVEQELVTAGAADVSETTAVEDPVATTVEESTATIVEEPAETDTSFVPTGDTSEEILRVDPDQASSLGGSTYVLRENGDTLAIDGCVPIANVLGTNIGSERDRNYEYSKAVRLYHREYDRIDTGDIMDNPVYRVVSLGDVPVITVSKSRDKLYRRGYQGKDKLTLRRAEYTGHLDEYWYTDALYGDELLATNCESYTYGDRGYDLPWMEPTSSSGNYDMEYLPTGLYVVIGLGQGYSHLGVMNLVD